MSEPEQDTEILLAILSSLLQPPIPSQDILLNALIRYDGDVEAAAKHLGRGPSSPTTKPPNGKRSAQGCLDGWLDGSSFDYGIRKKRKPNIPCDEPASTSSKEVNDSIAEAAETQSNIAKSWPIKSQDTPLLDSVPSLPRLRPLMLSNPDLVKKHTPCTMHLRVLPPELASRLFYVMVDASKGWKPSKWFLVDRVIESPHKSFFYARASNGVDDNTEWQNFSQYWYNGQMAGPPAIFPPEMEEACQIVESVVNAELKKRQRHPLEWGGSALDGHSWKANVAVSNCYTGSKEGVGFHSDQLTYLGPVPTIASLSLGLEFLSNEARNLLTQARVGTSRIFRLREVIPQSEKENRQAQTFNIPVVHNSLVIMHASTQERFKHTIPSQKAIDIFHPSFPPPIEIDTSDVGKCRINITFRFYRPDFRPETTPMCKCNIPCILRPDLKRRVEGQEQRYFWMCYAGLQKDGTGCSFVKVMDCTAEGRGPFIGGSPAKTRITNSSNGNST